MSSLFGERVALQVRDERGLAGVGGQSLDSSHAASVLGGGEELDVFLQAALLAEAFEEDKRVI